MDNTTLCGYLSAITPRYLTNRGSSEHIPTDPEKFARHRWVSSMGLILDGSPKHVARTEWNSLKKNHIFDCR